jgi:hypothetical protein
MNILLFIIGIKQTIDESILKRLIYFIKQTMPIEKKSNIVILQLFYSLINFVCFLENQLPQFSNEYNEFGYLYYIFIFIIYYKCLIFITNN